MFSKEAVYQHHWGPGRSSPQLFRTTVLRNLLFPLTSPPLCHIHSPITTLLDTSMIPPHYQNALEDNDNMQLLFMMRRRRTATKQQTASPPHMIHILILLSSLLISTTLPHINAHVNMDPYPLIRYVNIKHADPQFHSDPNAGYSRTTSTPYFLTDPSVPLYNTPHQAYNDLGRVSCRRALASYELSANRYPNHLPPHYHAAHTYYYYYPYP